MPFGVDAAVEVLGALSTCRVAPSGLPRRTTGSVDQPDLWITFRIEATTPSQIGLCVRSCPVTLRSESHQPSDQSLIHMFRRLVWRSDPKREADGALCLQQLSYPVHRPPRWTQAVSGMESRQEDDRRFPFNEGAGMRK